MKGSDCPKCTKHYHKTTEEYFEELKNNFPEIEVVLEKSDYKDSHSKITFKCPTHGEYKRDAFHALRNATCPMCTELQKISDGEIELGNLISTFYDGEINRNNRGVIYPQELDVYLPDVKIAFEYDGLYWHGDEKKQDNLYHKKKTDACSAKGVRLYHIYEDDWKYKRPAVECFLKRVLNHPIPEIEASVCDFTTLTIENASEFMEVNSLYGKHDYNTAYSLRHDGSIVSVLVGKKDETSFTIKYIQDANGVQVIGAFERFVSEIKGLHTNKTIFFDVDRRFDTSSNYTDKGFIFEGFIQPDYEYFTKDCRIPNNNIEEFLENSVRVSKIYDCGYERLRLTD